MLGLGIRMLPVLVARLKGDNEASEVVTGDLVDTLITAKEIDKVANA